MGRAVKSLDTVILLKTPTAAFHSGRGSTAPRVRESSAVSGGGEGRGRSRPTAPTPLAVWTWRGRGPAPGGATRWGGFAQNLSQGTKKGERSRHSASADTCQSKLGIKWD